MAANTGQPSSLGMDEEVSASVTKSRHPDTHSSTADTGGTFLFTHRYHTDKAKKKNGGQHYEIHIYIFSKIKHDDIWGEPSDNGS